MKTRLFSLTAATIVFSLLLSMVLFPPVFAKGNNNNHNNGGNDKKDNKVEAQSVSAKTQAGDFNTHSNSHASVNNDNSVHINQGNNGGGNAPDISKNRHNGNNGNNNNNNKHDNNNNNNKKNNNNDKKDTPKPIEVTENITVTHVNEPAPQAPAPIVQPVIQENNNNQENNNENVNENVNEVHVNSDNTNPEPQVVYYPEPVYYEVASYQQAAAAPNYTVYPAPKGLSKTPDTGAADFALLALPSMAGAGFFLRRRFGF